MGGKRKYLKNFDDSHYEEIGVTREHFVRQKFNKLMFFTGRSSGMEFAGLNLAQSYTLKEARLFVVGHEMQCEIVTLTDIENELKRENKYEKIERIF